jgi:hypothetical protein
MRVANGTNRESFEPWIQHLQLGLRVPERLVESRLIAPVQSGFVEPVFPARFAKLQFLALPSVTTCGDFLPNSRQPGPCCHFEAVLRLGASCLSPEDKQRP